MRTKTKNHFYFHFCFFFHFVFQFRFCYHFLFCFHFRFFNCFLFSFLFSFLFLFSSSFVLFSFLVFGFLLFFWFLFYPFKWIQLNEWSNHLNMNGRLHLSNKLKECGKFLWIRLWNLCFISMKESIFHKVAGCKPVTSLNWSPS